MMLIIHLDKNGKLKSKAKNIDPFTYKYCVLVLFSVSCTFLLM